MPQGVEWNVIAPPPAVPDDFRPGPDDADALLRAFFRSEMPEPWPALKHLPAPSRRRNRSRFALAASVALLLAGSLALAGALKPGAPERAGKGLGPEAKLPKDLRPADAPK